MWAKQNFLHHQEQPNNSNFQKIFDNIFKIIQNKTNLQATHQINKEKQKGPLNRQMDVRMI
jgi:hypothetical protein